MDDLKSKYLEMQKKQFDYEKKDQQIKNLVDENS